jgi:ferredoxin
MFKVIIFGNASQSQINELEVTKYDLQKTILEFLRENGIPVASSCLGEGVCSMCVINDKLLSCLHLVKEIKSWDSKVITIDYL